MRGNNKRVREQRSEEIHISCTLQMRADELAGNMVRIGQQKMQAISQKLKQTNTDLGSSSALSTI